MKASDMGGVVAVTGLTGAVVGAEAAEAWEPSMMMEGAVTVLCEPQSETIVLVCDANVLPLPMNPSRPPAARTLSGLSAWMVPFHEL